MKRYIPKYVQLMETLKKEIALCKVGDRFPTQLQIMRKHSASCATVSRALDELVENGMLQRLRGKGTFVSSTVPAPRPVAADLPDLALFLDTGENPLTRIDDLNWFLYAQMQQGIVNSYRGHCTIFREEAFLAALQGEQVSQAILVNPRQELVEKVQTARIPYIIISQNLYHWENNAILINHMTGIIEAIDYLHRDLGHTRIALISMENKAHSDRSAAFRIAMHSLGLPIPQDHICFTGTGSMESGREAIRELMSLPEPPTAVLVDTDLKAFGALEYLAENNIPVPEELSLIGFDNREECCRTTPQLSSIDCSFVSIGQMAVEVLAELVESGKLTIPNRTFMTSLVIRRSCAPPKR